MLVLAAFLAFAALFVLRLKLADTMNDINHRLYRILVVAVQTKGEIMALSDEVKAFAAEVAPQIDAAVAELQKIDAALNGAGDPDVPGARAALDALREKFAALKAAVDVPEPGDAPPQT